MSSIKQLSILPKKDIITELEGRKIKLSNLDKLIFPEIGIVKAELIQYYMKIAPYILPHLYNRPLTLIRFPDGVDGKRFYSKNKPSWTPEWIQTIQLDKEDDNTYVMANDLPSLAWIANLAALELHPMLTTAPLPEHPNQIIFDLDPPANAEFEVVKQLAFRLRLFLESYGYQPFVKTSGSKGLHIYVPIHPIYKQPKVVVVLKDLAKEYIKSDPTTTLIINKEKRQGKVLLDIYRNHKSQTCVAPYSTRGRKGAPISTPLFWEELKDITSSQAFTINTILDKLKADGDPWKHFRDNATYLHTDQENDFKNKVIDTKVTPIGILANIEEIELSPMLATLGNKMPSKLKYIYEIKWDGIRVMILKKGSEVKIISRKGNELTEKFPVIRDQFKAQLLDSFIVDAELIVLNTDGTPNFSKTVGRMHLSGSESIKRASRKDKAVVYLFDALYVDKYDVRNEPLEVRRQWLQGNINWSDDIRFSETFEDGKQLFKAIKTKKMEGIMCKLKGSRYASNTRSSAWLKIKVQNEDQALIIGYTKGSGDRSSWFGALHLGKFEDEGMKYFGKVGTGFKQSELVEIFKTLSELEQIKKPIKEAVEDEKNSIWINPVYSCEIRFASMTNNNTYREPVFLKIFKTSKST